MYYHALFSLLISLTFGSFASGQALKRDRPAPARPVSIDESILRQAIYDTAATYLGMTEKTNHNDAKWISKINRYNGLSDRAFYCASAFNYVHRVNGLWLPVKAPGAVSSYFSDKTKIIYRRNQRGNNRSGIQPQKMDAVSLYASHIEAIAEDRFDPDADYVRCIGFNTTGGKGTKGGCYVNRRRMSEIKFIANWITPTLKQYKQ
ncbi:hypothetical protein [Spirosoma sp.]|uniref:hypothetical protein n=1 Tax=Spirosoma sp. TaxID=1899569 RepID=UPI00261BE593|nr:hypothetical protein [Spirosoma sp.]MCX6216573.1 hypothetical protein [Spirosoma sp.]